MKHSKLRIVGLFLLLIGFIFLSSPAQARRVKGGESYSASEIANIIGRSASFYRRDSMFISGIPDSISRAVAENIVSTRLFNRPNIVCVPFSEIVRISKLPVLERAKYEKKHIITYGFYLSSEENGHTVDDVLFALNWMRADIHESIGGDIALLHIILSSFEIDFDVFTHEQLDNIPLVNYLMYFRFTDGELQEHQ